MMIIKAVVAGSQARLRAVISAFFLNTAYARNKNISLIRNPDIPTERYTRIAIINLDYNDICRNVFKVAKGR